MGKVTNLVDYTRLDTEVRNPRSRGLDQMSTEEIVRLINDDQRVVADVIDAAALQIAQAVDVIAGRMRHGGSLLYIGAGTSGRLAVLDAAECLPTFGVGPNQISAVIAGGEKAMFVPVEASEDDEEAGAYDVAKRVTERDVVVGVSASGVTPYVKGGLRAARKVGAATVAVVCNPPEMCDFDADIIISLPVGPEILTGSTRMKAGTAQKIVLNIISTAAMVRLGKVYDNLMVDLRPTNNKLKERAIRIVSMATGLGIEESREVLRRAEGNVKAAIVMATIGASFEEASDALRTADGHVRAAINAARGRVKKGYVVSDWRRREDEDAS